MSSPLPQHIAVIMDGNGRWAQQQGLPRTAGHRAGARAVRAIVTECRALGIGYLTLYTFSQENWKRPKDEVSTLFNLLVEFLGQEVPQLVEQRIVLNVLGEMDALPLPARTALKHGIQRTVGAAQGRPAMTLNLALNYGGRDEIVRAARRLMTDGFTPDTVTEDAFAARLYTAGQPDPDMVIRTSGEMRISNYLLFQCAYSELYFCETLWPDFTPQTLHEALHWYSTRHRRFGKTQEQCV